MQLVMSDVHFVELASYASEAASKSNLKLYKHSIWIDIGTARGTPAVRTLCVVQADALANSATIHQTSRTLSAWMAPEFCFSSMQSRKHVLIPEFDAARILITSESTGLHHACLNARRTARCEQITRN